MLALERQVLQNLCRAGIKSVSPDDRQALARYSWQGPDHQIIFQALFRLANISSAALRHQLPAEATRLGFPEIPWDEYFEVPANDECNPNRTINSLIAELLPPSNRAR